VAAGRTVLAGQICYTPDGKMKLTATLLVCAAAMSAEPAPDSIKLDNEFVCVSFLTDQPRTKTPLHLTSSIV
jgi:hypothetical protein